MTARVFCEDQALELGARVRLSPEEVHYAVRVRRVKPGENIEVFDGRGAIVRAVVREVAARRCEIEIGSAITVPRVPERVVLLGVPDPSATLEAIAHACELGAQTVVLVPCRRSQGATPAAVRIDRVLRASQRQCGRAHPPRIRAAASLDAALAEPDRPPGYVATPGATTDRPAVRLPTDAAACVLVGPEGGLTDDEVALAYAHGLSPLWLGPWILRTPVAVAAALANMLPGHPSP